MYILAFTSEFPKYFEKCLLDTCSNQCASMNHNVNFVNSITCMQRVKAYLTFIIIQTSTIH